MTTHILYLSDDQTICNHPERLDNFSDLVKYTPATVENPPCKVCNAILMAWNEKNAQEDELLYTHNSNAHKYGVTVIDAEPRGARALLLGMFLSSIFWIVLAILLERVF